VTRARIAPAGARPHARRSARGSSRRRRWGRIAFAAVVGAGLAFAITQIDFEKAILEITLPLRHDDIIRQQAAEKNLDPALIAAVIYEESKFREGERSSAGALGLMQVTPRTAHLIARRSGGSAFTTRDLEDPEVNIRYGSYYLRYLLDRYDGNEVAALAAYNAGIGNVDSWGGADLTVEGIRFAETRAYVDQVLERRGEYRRKYAHDLGLTG